MGQAMSGLECRKCEASSGLSDVNFLPKHPRVKRPKVEEVSRSCYTCKTRKIIEEMPKQKVKFTPESNKVKNRWDEMGNDSRSKMPWKATCY